MASLQETENSTSFWYSHKKTHAANIKEKAQKKPSIRQFSARATPPHHDDFSADGTPRNSSRYCCSIIPVRHSDHSGPARLFSCLFSFAISANQHLHAFPQMESRPGFASRHKRTFG
ncbi:hypothetical protein Bbelb_218360 [Branchiostoma belcheri]|nr:hypothetical protein Bbelb_218360 [Branchiostoma belcheri]